MNKCIFSFYLLVCSLSICAQDSYFHINGKVDPKYNGVLTTLFTITGNIIRSVDSTYVEDGHFHFKGPEYLYEKSIISIGNYPDTVLYAELFLERGTIEVELKQNSVVRSPLALEYRQYLDSCAEFRRQIKAAVKRNEWVSEMELKLCEYKFRFKRKYIHNGMGRGLFLKEAYNMEDPYFEELYKMLSDKDKSRGDVKAGYESRKKRLNQQSLVGQQFKDFVLISSKGEKKCISEYVGKHELLFMDFWASWCGPCRAQEPHLITLRQKYKNRGFEILAISLDTNRDSWLSVLKKKSEIGYELCIKEGKDDKLIRELYNIVSIPWGVLVNKSGEIIRVIRGYPELQNVLEVLYGKE